MSDVWSTLLYTIIYVIFLITLLFLTICCYLVKVHWTYSHIPGPPLDSFFFGNTPKLREYIKKGKYSHLLFLSWAQQYGPVFKVILLHKCLVLLTGQTGIKNVLTNSRFSKDPMIYNPMFSVCGERFLGRGLVTLIDHDAWFKRRAAINPAFHKRFLRQLMSQFNARAEIWTGTLEPLVDHKTTIDLMDSLADVTLDIIGQVGLDTDFKALEENSPFSGALWKILEGFSAQLMDPVLKFRPGKQQFLRDVKEAVKTVRSQGRKVVEGRLKELENEAKVPNNALTFLAKCKESVSDLTLDDLVDDFCTFLVAGQETTANMLGFLFKELGRKPEVKQRLVEEIDKVIGDRKHVTYEDLGHLEYVGQVVKETLRLYPPAMGTVRNCPSDTVVEGVRIPKGTSLVFSFFVIHRLPQYFEDPDEFRPERFAADTPRKLYTYMPFSLGQRSCAGQHFAMIEAKMLICKFFRMFDYDLDPNQPMGIQQTSTLRPKGGTVITLRRRNNRKDTQS